MVSEPECGQGEHLHSKVAWPGYRSLRGVWRASSGHGTVQNAKARGHG